MKKNYLFLIATLMLNALMFAQTVSLTPTAVNNTNVNSGPINLASVPTSTVSLNVKVDIPSNVAVSDYGTLKIYYSNSSVLNANIASGGDSGTLFFGGGRIATRSIVINLFWSDFLTSGGFIFAEYKNPAGTAYRSSNLAVIKNSTMNLGTTLNPPADAPNPTKIPNSLCCNQTVRLGERPQPITGSQFLNPYANEPYGIKASWETNGNPLPPNILNVDNINHSLSLDHTTSLGSFTVKRKLGYVYRNEYPNTSNTVTITVVPSPITSNEIHINGPVNTDESFEISSSNPKDIFGDRSYINLNVLQDPYYVPKRGDTNISIDKYEWEYSIVNGTTEERAWNIIPNQSSGSLNSVYLPRSNNSKDNLYTVRRIAIYQNLRVSSNPLKIWIRAVRENNTICCNQSLEVSSANIVETPSIITGTTTISNTNKYLFYQWQSQTITENGGKVSNWINIPSATSKDYLPPTPEFMPGDGRNFPKVPTYSYRRIATDNAYNGETYYSNEITLTPSTNVYSVQTLKIYPNPATSILNIENINGSGIIDLNIANIIITNTMGYIVNSNDFTRINSNLANINVSNLANGVYFLTITSNTDSRRTYSEQFTFIKQ